MAKLVEYDVEGVEESGGGTGVKVPIGLRVARIALCEQRVEKADGTAANDIRVGLDFGPEYDWGFTYIGLGAASDWKLAEFVRAVGLKDKGKFDPDKQIDKLIRVKVNHGTYEGEYSPQMGKLFAAAKGDKLGVASETSQTAGKSNQAEEGSVPDGDGVDVTTSYPDGFEPSREGDDFGSYDDWSDDDLAGEVEDRGLAVPGGRGNKKDKLVAALRADDNEAADASDPDADATSEVDADGGDDYESWDLEALTKEWNDREMGDVPAFRGRNAEARIIAEIIEKLREDDSASPFS